MLIAPSEGKEKYSPNALIILKAETIQEMQGVEEEIKAYGGHIDHIFPPKGLIGYLPPEVLDYFATSSNIFSIEGDIADERGLGQLGESAGIAAHVWNTVFCDLPAAASTAVSKGIPQMPENDAVVAPDRELLWQKGEERISNVPGSYETSEFFIGSVVVGIITPESNGLIDLNTENWDSARQSTVVAKITEGLQWWKDNDNAPSNISFIYDIHHNVPTNYEPISRAARERDSDEGLWISETMENLGYTFPGWQYGYYTQVREYLNEKRNSFKTDWAFGVFVVDSLNDDDGKFLNADYAAYASLNGPFMVMTYDNNGWGIDRMQIVMAHESEHIFGALDEYAESECKDADTGGYLNIANTNCENGDTSTEDSIMRSAESQKIAYPNHLISTPVRQMVGWRDSDGDGKEKYDPVDTTPAVSLNPFSPDPTDDSTPTFTGSTQDIPYDSPDPDRTDITINIISKVEWRLDGEEWQNATATDGSFDSYNESFSFTPGSLNSGTFLFEVRAITSVGNTSSIVQDTLTVKLNQAPNLPGNPSPEDGATGVSIIPTLSWNGGDPDSGDIVTYDVYFDTSGATTKVSSGQSSTSYGPGGTLRVATIYYWKIVARDNKGAEAEGDIWSFTTKLNTPPIANAGSDRVVVTGLRMFLDGSKSYDPNGDNITYQWSLVSKSKKSISTLSNSSIQDPDFIPDVDGTYKMQLIVNDGKESSQPDSITIVALGGASKIMIGVNNTDYKTGESIDIYLWVANSNPFKSLTVDAFIGLILPSGELQFFNPFFGRIPCDISDPTTFTPFAKSVLLPRLFIFPNSKELNYDSDGNGKNDTYLLVSFKIPDAFVPGQYLAFAAMTEAGSVQSGIPKIIGNISILEFSVKK